MTDKAIEAASKVAWKNSIFADNKFSADLRRRNTVRDIFTVGFSAGYNYEPPVDPKFDGLLREVIERKNDEYRKDGFAAATAMDRWTVVETDGLPEVGDGTFWHDKQTGFELFGYLTRKGDVLIYSNPKPLRFTVECFDAWCPRPQPYTVDKGATGGDENENL